MVEMPRVIDDLFQRLKGVNLDLLVSSGCSGQVNVLVEAICHQILLPDLSLTLDPVEHLTPSE